jgi:predicted ATPase/DNA-binding XRE family transcriptional regulator
MAVVQPLPFGSLLRRYRVAAGLTQEELAERAGVSARGISDLERGARRAPYRGTIARLADALRLALPERAAFEAAAGRHVGLHPAPAEPQAHSGLISALPPFVGRIDELALLDRHLNALAGDSPPLLLVAGEPGIGKTRLLQEAAARARAAGWSALQAGCHRRSGQEPYAPILGAIEGGIARQPTVRLRLALDGCAWLARLLPELADMAIVPAPSWMLSPEQERRLMFAAVIRFLGNVAGAAGTLLVLDDLQWAGVDALNLLVTLARATSQTPLRILGAYRDTEVRVGDPLAMLLADLAQAGLATQAELGPLSPAEATTLLDDLLLDAVGPAPASDRAEAQRLDTKRVKALDTLEARVLRRAGGVPFFLVSCAHALRACAADEDATGAVPWSVAQQVRQRVAALSAPAQELLSVAAVIERAAPGRLLVAAATCPASPEHMMLAVLKETCRARLLVELEDDSYAFAHDLIREGVEADLDGRQRKILHRRVAVALEQEADETAAAQLAYHFGHAGVLDKAALYLARAGDRAWRMHANAEARMWYDERVRTLERLGRTAEADAACEKLAATLVSLGEHERALEALARAAHGHRAAADLEALARVIGQIGRAHARGGTPEEGIAALRAFLESPTAEGLSPRSQAAVYAGLAQLYQAAGHYGEQLRVAERAADLARRARDAATLAQVEVRRGSALCMLGRSDEGLQALASALSLAEANGDLRSLSSALNGLAEGHLIRGELSEHRQYVERACTVAEQLDDAALLAFMWLNRGDNGFYRGAWGLARADYERALAVLRQAQTSWYSAYAALDMGMLSQAEGDWEAAATCLDEAIALASRGEDLQALRWARCIAAERALLVGNGSAVRQVLTSLLDRAGEQEREVILVLALLAWATLEAGDEGGAQVLATASIERATSARDRLLMVDALRIQALLWLHQRRWTEAERALTEAIALARAMPYPYAEAKALYVYGALYAERGEFEPARERLEAALAICGRLGERLYAGCAERLLARIAGTDASTLPAAN